MYRTDFKNHKRIQYTIQWTTNLENLLKMEDFQAKYKL